MAETTREKDVQIDEEEFTKGVLRAAHDLMRKSKAYHEELMSSGPRARITLSVAHFEERVKEALLDTFVGLRRCSELVELDRKEQKRLKEAVPRDVFLKIDLGYALGLYPLDTAMKLHEIRDLRNDAVHKLQFLDKHTSEKIVRAVHYLQKMENYLSEMRAHTPGPRYILGSSPPDVPVYPEVQKKSFTKQFRGKPNR